MFNNIKADIHRYMIIEEICSFRKFLLVLPFTYSLWSLLAYRFGRWARNDCKMPVLAQLFKILSRLIQAPVTLLTGIQIPFETQIGKGLYIGHIGYLIVNSHSIIGDNCNISAGVVIGEGGRGENKGSPVIGNNVYIAPGAKVFGKIHIGNNVAIGANAVVTKDVPDNAVAVGIPAKVINSSGSADFIKL